MPLRFDSVLKHLLAKYAKDFLRLLHLDPTVKVRVIDSDISTVTTSADKVLLIEGKKPWILHLEFQASKGAELSRRVAKYNLLLEARHKVPVKSVVFLLRKKAEHSKVTGEFRSAIPDNPAHMIFNYTIVKLWTMSPEELMAHGVGLLPLIALTNVPVSELPNWIRRVEERVKKEPKFAEIGEFWAAAKILAGLLYPVAVANQLFKGVRDMRESSVYRDIERKGRLKGRAEGAQRYLLLQGTKLFGDPSASVRARLANITSQAELDELSVRLLQVGSWNELLSIVAPQDDSSS